MGNSPTPHQRLLADINKIEEDICIIPPPDDLARSYEIFLKLKDDPYNIWFETQHPIAEYYSRLHVVKKNIQEVHGYKYDHLKLDIHKCTQFELYYPRTFSDFVNSYRECIKKKT